MTGSPLDRVTIPATNDGVALVIAICRQIGYGRVDQIAKQAWLDDHGENRFVCPWCDVDQRTGKKSKQRRVRR